MDYRNDLNIEISVLSICFYDDYYNNIITEINNITVKI